MEYSTWCNRSQWVQDDTIATKVIQMETIHLQWAA